MTKKEKVQQFQDMFEAEFQNVLGILKASENMDMNRLFTVHENFEMNIYLLESQEYDDYWWCDFFPKGRDSPVMTVSVAGSLEKLVFIVGLNLLRAMNRWSPENECKEEEDGEESAADDDPVLVIDGGGDD